MPFIASEEIISSEHLPGYNSAIENFYFEHVQLRQIQSPDGLRLCAALYEPENWSRSLLVIPGRGETAHKYAELIFNLRQKNLRIAVCFARGQGNSQRLLADPHRCHIRSFDELSEDIWTMLKALNFQNFGLLGFSLGGLIGLDFIRKCKLLPHKAAMLVPFLWPAYAVPPVVLYAVVNVLGAIPVIREQYTPYGSDYKRIPFEENHHSHCRLRYEAYHDYYALHPELNIGSPTWSFVREALRTQKMLYHTMAELPVPFYCRCAGVDKVVSTARARLFFSTRKGCSCDFGIIDDAWHDILNESDCYRTPALCGALNFLFSSPNA